MVALGILSTRVMGLVRMRVFGHFLGTSDAADAFLSAIRIPNLLQNLFGEGALSASFIPVYARLVNSDDHVEATRLARAVAALLALVVSVIVLAGVLLTPVLVTVIAPGFTGEKRELTITLVRILWPGTGLLVISAWCLGILNSHGRFFLSYAAPVVWNLAQIGALLWFGRTASESGLVVAVAWAAVAGSLLQVLVQMPVVWRVLVRVKGQSEAARENVKVVIRNFLPALTSRGVIQISAYLDLVIATFLPSGAPSAINYAQTLYNLPVSLFGMSVAAAELPRMAGSAGDEEERFDLLRGRLRWGLRQIAFFVVPTVASFVALGHVIAAALFQTGRFSREDSLFVWKILAAAAVGLLASTLARLYSSTFFALRDTRTPMRFAIVRVGLGVVLGVLLAVIMPRAMGIDRNWGAPGLALAGSLAGWVEYVLLRRALRARIGAVPTDWPYLLRIWFAAITAASLAWLLYTRVSTMAPLVVAAIVLGTFCLAYLSLALATGIPEAQRVLARFRGRRGAP